jgi:hypothetical protein
MENIFLFISVILAENVFFNRDQYYFVDLKLIYIILAGTVYGTKNSILAVFLSSSLYIYSSFVDGMDFVSLFYNSTTLIHIAYYLFTGFVVGYTIDLRNRKEETQIVKIAGLEDKLRFTNAIYKETKNVKEELQRQIRTSEDSFGKIYSIIRDLDVLAVENIFSAAVDVIERIMKVRSVGIYAVSSNGNFARLVANSKGIPANASKSIRLNSNEAVQYIKSSMDIFVNRKLEPNLPMMMAPIFDNNVLVAFITIENFDFENVNLYNQNLFKVVASLVSSALSRAYRYEEATNEKRFIKGTTLLNEESFNAVLDNKIRIKEKDMANFALLSVEARGSLEDLSYKLTNSIREVDYIGLVNKERVHIILSNTNETEADAVIERLAQKGIKAAYEKGLTP